MVFTESCGMVQRSKTGFLCSFGAERVKCSNLFRNPALKAIRVDTFFCINLGGTTVIQSSHTFL